MEPGPNQGSATGMLSSGQPVQAAAPTRDQELDALLEQGCAHYDDGRTAEAVACWEEVQSQDPGNTLARGYLEGARRKLEREASNTGALPALKPQVEAGAGMAPYAPPTPLFGQNLDNQEQLLRDGCTLFDMGQVEDALLKWQRILQADPQHQLALAYSNAARKDLGLAPLETAQELRPVPVQDLAEQERAPQLPDSACDEPVEKLVHDGVQLYDLGMVEEAMDIWRRALNLDPSHDHAAEYLRMAEKDQQQQRPAPAPPVQPVEWARPVPAALRAPVAPVPSLEARLLEAERLLDNQKFEAATQAFHLLLQEHPGVARIHQGYKQASALLATEAPRLAVHPNEGQTTSARPMAIPSQIIAPVGAPKAVTARTATVRDGLKVPSTLQRLGFPAWLSTPRNLGLSLGGLVLLALGAVLLRDHAKEAALKQAVLHARAEAMKPVSRQLEVATLAETPETLRQEAESALAEDPLQSYYRAQEWLKQEPGSAAAAQLVDKARTRMATMGAAGNLGDFQLSMQAGDMESALTTIQQLLRQTPDDPELREKARAVNLALGQFYAGKERFGDAKDCLLRVRAMFPQERIWSAKLRLLETIQTMPKADRAGWIQMLG